MAKRGVKFMATDEMRYTVEVMIGIGLNQLTIAQALGIDEKTLRLHFRKELDCGKARILTKIGDSIIRQALAGNMTAAIFYMKTQGRWSERVTIEHSGPGGTPIRHDHRDLSQMTDAELQALAGDDD